MNTYKSLIDQREALNAQINDALKQEKPEILKQIKTLSSEYNISIREIAKVVDGKSFVKQNRGKVPAKYMNKETGQLWSGRGKEPSWIKGKDRSEFTI